MPVEKIDAKITLTPTQIGELVKAANAPSPTIFEKIAMRGFKVSGEDVRKLSTMFSTAQAIVGAIGTITGAYSTINSALKLIGVLEPDDPFKEARELINSWFVDMRDYYQDREYAEQAARRSKWDTAVSNAAGALDNLSKSRSKANFDAALKKFDDLYSALFEMLDLAFVNDLQAAVPAAGSITFSSGAYGYPPDEFKYPPSHWVPYARAAYMKTVAGAPIHVQQDLTGETDEKTRTYLGAS